MMLRPILIPLVGTIAGCGMIVIIVAITFWHKTRMKELDIHREMRLREMEHERNLKQVELDIEKLRATHSQR
ncbi:MAG: hypothetical protein ACRD1I_04915 [Terriglobia bacterium]